MLDLNRHQIRSLHLSFDLPIRAAQTTQWRGAFIEMAGWEDDLFHNHRNGQAKQYQYRYPLIQYRVHRRKAAIVAFNQGIEAVQKTLASKDWRINWQGEARPLLIEDLRMQEHYFRTVSEPKTYHLKQWLALNEKNHKLWDECKGLQERVPLLERLLGSHLMSSIWGLGWEPSERIEVQIEHIDRMQSLMYHRTPLKAFDITYTCNALLPQGLGIGKGVSHGFGWQYPERSYASSSKPNNKKPKENQYQ